MNKKIHRAFNTLYLIPAKKPFSTLEGGGGLGAEFVANSIPDTVGVHQVDYGHVHSVLK